MVWTDWLEWLYIRLWLFSAAVSPASYLASYLIIRRTPPANLSIFQRVIAFFASPGAFTFFYFFELETRLVFKILAVPLAPVIYLAGVYLYWVYAPLKKAFIRLGTYRKGGKGNSKEP